MAFSTMHFGVGMACGAAAGLAGCVIARRGWRWIPAAATLGGVWAMAPDLPRIFREDFPSLPFASTLGAESLEKWLHAHGDWFFFHGSLDAQPKEFALLGLGLILLGYNLSIAHLLWLEHRQRNSVANRAWRAHEAQLHKRKQTIAAEAEDEVYEGDPVIHRIGEEKTGVA